LHLYYFPS